MELLARFGAPPRELKVVGLVCTGHFFSHFYLLVIPPLFPLLKDIYGVGFTELGLATAAFSVASGFTQIPVGFLVDKYGANRILAWGLATESIAFMLIPVFPAYGALVALMVAAGLSNSVFHPADYAILNTTVDKSRIGRTFSLHTFTGYLGDAVAPGTVLLLASLFDWRTAVFVCGVAGAVTAAALWMNSGILVNIRHEKPAAASRRAGGKAPLTGIALLMSLPLLMGLLFFATMSTANSGVRTFGVSALHEMYQWSLGSIAAVVSAYLFVSTAGVLVGGYAADKIKRHDLVAAACIIVMALSTFVVAAFDLSLMAIGALFTVAGFCNGVLAPARDMVIRALAPPSEMGKVFGFVSSGFALSGIVAPIMYGFILDHADPRNVFWASGIVGLLTICTVLGTGSAGRRAAARAA